MPLISFNTQRSRPGCSELAPLIRQWMKHLIKHKHVIPTYNERHFKTAIMNYESIFSSDDFAPNQDLMTGFALWMAGISKVQTVVNRAVHIGKNGITINENLWNIFGFDKIILDEFEQDQQITEFREVELK